MSIEKWESYLIMKISKPKMKSKCNFHNLTNPNAHGPSQSLKSTPPTSQSHIVECENRLRGNHDRKNKF